MNELTPASVAALIMSVVCVATVVFGVATMRSERRKAHAIYRSSVWAVEHAREHHESGTSAMVAARRDLIEAQCRADEHAAELETATEEMRLARSGVSDLATAVEQQTAALTPVERPLSGGSGATPVEYATWTDDGDPHYAQATLWPTGGGIDLNLAVNGSGESLSLDWRSFDVLVSLGARLRARDRMAPDAIEMAEATDDDLPFAECDRTGCPTRAADCPNCGQTEAARRVAWAEIAERRPLGVPGDKFEDPDLADD